MLKLTERQRAVLSFIEEFMEAEGMPPTRAEIARALGFRSVNAAEDHLKALARKRAVEMVPGTSRGIRLMGEGQGHRGIPVVGRVAAGHPILAEAHIQTHYRLDPKLFRPRADYLLTVKGMSMRDVGIWDGDLLAVHRTPEAANGQVVVARVEDEVTVKHFHRAENVVRLLPANEEFAPIEVDLRKQRFAIEGMGVGIIRTS